MAKRPIRLDDTNFPDVVQYYDSLPDADQAVQTAAGSHGADFSIYHIGRIDALLLAGLSDLLADRDTLLELALLHAAKERGYSGHGMKVLAPFQEGKNLLGYLHMQGEGYDDTQTLDVDYSSITGKPYLDALASILWKATEAYNRYTDASLVDLNHTDTVGSYVETADGLIMDKPAYYILETGSRILDDPLMKAALFGDALEQRVIGEGDTIHPLFWYDQEDTVTVSSYKGDIEIPKAYVSAAHHILENHMNDSRDLGRKPDHYTAERLWTALWDYSGSLGKRSPVEMLDDKLLFRTHEPALEDTGKTIFQPTPWVIALLHLEGIRRNTYQDLSAAIPAYRITEDISGLNTYFRAKGVTLVPIQ